MEVERVQAIATLSKFMETIPAEYVRSENEQPAITTVHGKVLEVPVINLLGGNTVNDRGVIAAVAEAAGEWGLFQVVNHGIPDEVIANLQKVGREFFELPAAEKEVYARPVDAESIEGYGTRLQKEVGGKKGWVDHLFHKVWPPSAINYKFWPKNPPSYREKENLRRLLEREKNMDSMVALSNFIPADSIIDSIYNVNQGEANEAYIEKLRPVADKLLKWLSMGIGLEGHELMAAVGGDDLIYMMKINYYPPCPRPDLALGVVAHTDMSTLTILVPNEVAGLQVFKDDRWYDVKYIPNALIVHIGDQIEILSNGKYKAVLHRTTVNKETTRMSWPVFLEPPSEREIGPIPKLISDENPPKFKTKKYNDYVHCKLNKIPQ